MALVDDLADALREIRRGVAHEEDCPTKTGGECTWGCGAGNVHEVCDAALTKYNAAKS